MLLHVGKRRPYLVWSLAGSTSIHVVMYLLITLVYGFIPLADLFISPGSELDITFACFFVGSGFTSFLVVSIGNVE